MVDALHTWGALASTPRREPRVLDGPDLVEWLRAGKLTLVDRNRNAVPVERWSDLPADARAKVLSDFRRVVGRNAVAAVLYVP